MKVELEWWWWEVRVQMEGGVKMKGDEEGEEGGRRDGEWTEEDEAEGRRGVLVGGWAFRGGGVGGGRGRERREREGGWMR